MSDDTACASKTCTKCGEDKPLTEYYPRGRKPGELRADCKVCHLAHRNAWARANRDKLREWYHGITAAQYAALSASQGDVCAICKKPETAICGRTGNVYPLTVDHDHTCCSGRQVCGKCIRGLLCGKCNRALGLLQDDPNLATAAAAYLVRGRLAS